MEGVLTRVRHSTGSSSFEEVNLSYSLWFWLILNDTLSNPC